MKLRSFIAATASVAVLGFSASAIAQSVPGYYVTGEGGVSVLPDLHINTGLLGQGHEHYDAGYAFGGALGYDTGHGSRVEIDALHQQSELTNISGTPVNGHLQSTSLMVNGQYDIARYGAVTPYVGAGLGVQNIGASAAPYRGNSWKPAYQAEAGLRTDVSDKVSLFGEYRFSQSEAGDLSSATDSARQHFSDHAFLAGLTYHMGS